jgi:hypothetical protein
VAILLDLYTDYIAPMISGTTPAPAGTSPASAPATSAYFGPDMAAYFGDGGDGTN